MDKTSDYYKFRHTKIACKKCSDKENVQVRCYFCEGALCVCCVKVCQCITFSDIDGNDTVNAPNYGSQLLYACEECGLSDYNNVAVNNVIGLHRPKFSCKCSNCEEALKCEECGYKCRPSEDEIKQSCLNSKCPTNQMECD